MADVQVNVKVDAKEADESIRGLTRQLKQLREQQAKLPEGSAAWKKLGQDINDLEGRLGDLNDRFNTLRGSGVERLQSSFGLLREGLTSADFGKAKIALQGIGQAMSAIPVLLIVTGIMKLIENFDKLKNSSGLLGTAFKAIGTIIDTLTGAIQDFTDWIGITNFESEKLAETQINNAKKIQDAVTERYDAEIRLAKAAGKNTEDLEKQKVMAVRQSLLEQIKLKAQAAVLDGELNEEELKNLDELRKALTESYIQEKEIDLKAKKEQDERNKKAYEERKKTKEKELDDSQKLADELFAELSKNQDTIDKQNAEARKRELDQKNKWYKDEKDIRNYWQKIAAEENAKIEKEVEDKAKEELEKKRQIRDAEFAIASASLNSLQSLSDTFFSIRLANLEEGSKKEQEVAKKQFNINKALAISSTLISGFQGVVNALTAKSTIPEPFGQALKVANAVSIGLATAANVAKISAQQFKATGGSTGGGGAPRTGGGNTPNVNTPTPPQAQLPNQQGTFIQDQRVYVLESDISKAQSRVTRVEEQARF